MSGITLSIKSALVRLNSTAYCSYHRGPLLYSCVIQNLSWQMGFWFTAIALGICLLLVFFFVPEVRQPIPFCDLTMIIVSTQTTYIRVNRDESISTTNDPEEGGLEDKSLPSAEGPIPSSKSYVSQLRIWNGTYSQANILKIFLRPFPFLLSPIVGHLFFLKTVKF